MHIIHPKYRADVDGLRAVAVLQVVAFHAFPAYMTGSFISVDVFLIISGYLISTIIFHSLEKDRFSLAQFYNRRVRRILPSLVAIFVRSYLLIKEGTPWISTS